VRIAVLVALGLAACARPPRPAILSTYGDPFAAGSDTQRRRVPHDGVDVGAPIGGIVIAAADGEVENVRELTRAGMRVAIRHGAYLTDYIHLRSVAVRSGQRVRRGDVIGEVGLFYWSGGIPHVHWRLCRERCRRKNTLDPLAHTIGCYSATTKYPSDRIVLTYPVRC
jgi:murein DD-endopeptidase MepM/ murein hydrolase activator NlpD